MRHQHDRCDDQRRAPSKRDPNRLPKVRELDREPYHASNDDDWKQDRAHGSKCTAAVGILS